MTEKLLPSWVILPPEDSSGKTPEKLLGENKQIHDLVDKLKKAEEVREAISDWSAKITRYGSIYVNGLDPKKVVSALAVHYQELTGERLTGEGTPYYFGGTRSHDKKLKDPKSE